MRLLIFLISLCIGTWALYESDVGVVDWHKELIGVPLAGPACISPSFHRVENRTVILAATTSNVLAALEPEDGSVLWRYIFSPEDRITGYYKNESTIATLSGPGGSTIRTFNASNGQILLEKRMHPPERAALLDPVNIGNDVIFSSDSSNIYVLSNGRAVGAIEGETGGFIWRWTSQNQGSLIIYKKLILTSNAIYVIGVAKSFASYTLHVTSLNPLTGEVIQSSDIAANIVDPWSEFTVVTPSSEQPVALWLEQGNLRYVMLTPNLKAKVRATDVSGYAQVKGVGTSDFGQVVLVRRNGMGVVMKVEDNPISVQKLWEFKDAPYAKNNSDSIYTSGLGPDGALYIGRFFWTHSLQKGSADIFAVHVMQGLSTGFNFPFNKEEHGTIKNVAFTSENPNELTIKTRLLIVTSTGAIQMWQDDELKWTREEALSGIDVAEFVDIPEKAIIKAGQRGVTESFMARIRRQVSEAQDFPQYVFKFAKRFATGSYIPQSLSFSPNFDDSEELSRDLFGFRQIIVAATSHGKIYGIDSSNGKIIWSRMLGLGWAEEVGAQIIPVKIFVTKSVSDGGDPEVVLVVQRRADNSWVDTVVFHFDAMTGRGVSCLSTDKTKLQGEVIISGPLTESFFLETESKMIILLDEFLQVYLYPDTPQTQAAFNKTYRSLSFPLRAKNDEASRVIGYQFTSLEKNIRPVAHPTWSYTFQTGEDIQALVPPAAGGPIASFGKVLGNRTTLYNYLNPRLFTVLTTFPTKRKCGLYVLDSMKGTVVYRVETKASSKGCEVKSTLMENWLLYHYFESEIESGAKGNRVVSVEFYEGQGIDEKTRSLELSAFSNETLNFHTREQSYIVTYAVTALTSTTTRFGISNKDLILATNDRKVRSMPRVFLNPRRPNRKPTTEEQEENLIQYDPVLPNDPKRVLSHTYEIANVKRIITSPPLLESTSLIFVYGLDMFFTRVAPSGTFDILNENFNKMQLVLTVCALFVGILITKPMVQRKQLQEKWYQ